MRVSRSGMPARNGLPRGPENSRCRSGWRSRLDAKPVAGRDDDQAPPVRLPRPFQPGRPGEPAQVLDGHLVEGLRIRLPAVRVLGGHEPEDVLAPEGVTDHHVGEPFIHERMPGGGIGIDVAAQASRGGAGEFAASSQVSSPIGRSIDWPRPWTKCRMIWDRRPGAARTSRWRLLRYTTRLRQRIPCWSGRKSCSGCFAATAPGPRW